MILTRDVESRPPVWINPYTVQQAYPFDGKTILMFGSGSEDCLQVADPWLDVVHALDAAISRVGSKGEPDGEVPNAAPRLQDPAHPSHSCHGGRVDEL